MTALPLFTYTPAAHGPSAGVEPAGHPSSSPDGPVADAPAVVPALTDVAAGGQFTRRAGL